MGLHDQTLGTLLAGTFFNTFLYGLVTHQFAVYYQTKFNDRTITNYMVLLLFFLDTFHSAAAIYMTWYYTVANFSNPAAFAVAIWPHTFTPLGTALAAFVTHIYLGFSVWRLTYSKILSWLSIALAIPPLVLGVSCSIEAFIVKFMSEMPRVLNLGIAWMTMQVVVDTYITVTLIIIYSRFRTGFDKTNTMLNRLIRGAVQTGLFAGIFAAATLISCIFFPKTNLYVMFGIPLGRIYTNTLLDNLLTRESIKLEIADERDMPPSGYLLTSRIVVHTESP